MSTVYRERERDRYDDSRTSVSSSRRDGTYTTVKRYRIGEDDSRSSVDRRFQVNRPGERVEETRIVRRELDVVEEPRRHDPEPRYPDTDLVIRRDREEESRRDFAYDRLRGDRDDTKELVIRRTTTRDEPREEVRDLRVGRYEVDRREFREQNYELLSPDRDRHPDLQRYSRSTEYFSQPQPQPPQTIIIKQEPIIIRERVRDDDYDIVRRSDVEDRTVARREPPREAPREEEYFYEKKTKEVEGSRREKSDEFYERRDREVSPHDSVSQVGRRDRSRGRDRDYESDDSMVYVRKETREEDYSRDESPHHRRHIAEGVIAGVGAAELLRHHRNKEGRETSGTLGRIGTDIGAGVIGAVGAQAITRARSRYRSKSRRRDHSRSRSLSRSRSRSGSRERRKSRSHKHKKESRSRSRSRSHSDSRSKLKTLTGLGLAAAGIAAAAAYAQKKSNDKNETEERGRSRSRSRQGRDDSTVDVGIPDDARNPSHRNKRVAQAGLGGAAVAGLIEAARSKSRARKGERSRSRIRQGLEVAAAGLGSAAIAGMYERSKGKKAAEAAEKENKRQERRAARERSRSTSRHPVGPYYDNSRNVAMSDGLIEYGDGPMYGNNYGADYYGRPAQQENYYSDAMVPVAAATGAAGAAYGAREPRDRSRSRSRDRRHSTSSSPEPNERRRRRHRKDRSRSAGHDAAVPGATGAGAAGETEQERKQRKREDKARRRAAENAGHDPYEDVYDPAPHAPAPPAAAPGGYGGEPGYYPPNPGFPPPPGGMPNQYTAQPQYAAPGGQYAPPPNPTGYNPTTFPPPPGNIPPQGPPANYNEAFASGANIDPYAARTREADENVSAAPSNGINPFPDQQSVPLYGLGSTGGPPPPSVVVHPPAPTPPPASASYNSSYVPPAERSQSPPKDPSQLRSESTSRRKSVNFTDGITNHGDSLESPDKPSQPSPPDGRQHRHQRSGELSRGYDAGDDTDSPPDEYRRRQQGLPSVQSQLFPPSNGTTGEASSSRRRHRRARSYDPSSSTSGPSSSQPQPSVDRNTAASPVSDETVELPERFDKYGRKKPESGEDVLTDKLKAFLAGKGATRKLFGNFADGLLG